MTESLKQAYDTIKNHAIEFSKNNPNDIVFMWYRIDANTFYFDCLPLPLYRERIVAIIQNGVVLKEKYK